MGCRAVAHEITCEGTNCGESVFVEGCEGLQLPLSFFQWGFTTRMAKEHEEENTKKAGVVDLPQDHLLAATPHL